MLLKQELRVDGGNTLLRSREKKISGSQTVFGLPLVLVDALLIMYTHTQ